MRILNKFFAILAMALGLISSAWAVVIEQPLFELYRADRDMYVMLYQGEVEIAMGRTASPWKQTGRSIVVNTTELVGQVPVARMYSFADTHVFVPPPEREFILKTWPNDWILESAQYYWADMPVNGACAKGVTLYRLYNNGRNGGPNHRFTTDLTEAQEIAKTGDWIFEGLTMCVAGAGTASGTALHSAGSILIEDSSHTIQFNLDAGKYFGMADKDGSYDVDPANIEKVCFNSNRRGWTDMSVACAPVGANHTVTLPKSCNNDEGLWSAKLRDGRWLWSDLTSQEAFLRKGFPSTLLPNGLVSYGITGYQPSQVTVAEGGKLRIDFGSNCLTGFGKPLEVEDLLFVWSSDQAGWGLNSITGSTKYGFIDWNAEKNAFFVEFSGLACSDRGNITVHKKLSGTGTSVVWDAGSDGFGYAWFSIPPKGEVNPVWQAGPGVTWDQDKWLVNYTIPGCTK